MNVPPDLLAKIDEAITHYPASKRSASLPLLHLWQEHFGFISDEAIAWIAQKLELQPINILELVTFYPMFRRQPAGKRHIRVCRTLSCAMAGSYELRDKMAAGCGDRSAKVGGGKRAPCQCRTRQSHRRQRRWRILASNSWNASPVAAARRWPWWTIASRKTSSSRTRPSC